jgi:putative ABC transport system permease protein
VQISLLAGFASTAAGLINHADVDLWVSARGTKNVDQAVEIPRRWRFRALELPGVATADNYITHFALLRRPDGGSESIVLVGYNVEDGVGAPWNLVEGSTADLKRQDGIIVDELYKQKLGIDHLGQVIEINGQRTRVVGFTRGIRTFVQSPYVFASFNTARRLGGLTPDTTKYVLIKTKPDVPPDIVRAQLSAALSAATIFDSASFALSTQVYWLFSTGAGMNLVLSALLGLVIGIVIAGQTLYASAMDHLPDYATLRAMGAHTSYLNRIIIKQALTNATVGYAIGISLASLLIWLFRDGQMAMRLSWQIVLGLGALTITMCTLAGLAALRRVIKVNPTSIFR